MAKEKKKPVDDITNKKLDRLASTLDNESPERLRTLLRADARLNLRLSVVEKEEIERTAKALDMTVTAYLLAIHRISREVLESKGIV